MIHVYLFEFENSGVLHEVNKAIIEELTSLGQLAARCSLMRILRMPHFNWLIKSEM